MMKKLKYKYHKIVLKYNIYGYATDKPSKQSLFDGYTYYQSQILFVIILVSC